jgi:signal recognition particle subunit SRP54
MFSNLSKKLVSIFDRISARGILTEEIIESTIREIRVSLLEADVALSVVKTFTNNLKDKLKDQKVIDSITPDQTIIKVVYDELVNLLGGGGDAFGCKTKGSVMMVGLQGTGKTTTSAKLSYLLKKKFNKKVLLVSLDTYRPAAIEQLHKLAIDNNLEFFDTVDLKKDTPLSIAEKTLRVKSKYDVVIYDTAGRLYIDQGMMSEIEDIKKVVIPDDIFLVIDSMMGQDSINTAKVFNESVNLTGLILTRVDGDARGGAALSAKSVTNCQIKYICTGEKINDIEEFHPDRIASRILDKGDVLGLVEKAIEGNIVSEEVDMKFGKDFNLNDMEKYLKQLEKLGGIGGFLKFIPGIGKIKDVLNNANVNDKTVSKQVAIIRSMTPLERKNPKILNASRRRRIASGSGQEVCDVNRLIKQFENAKSMMSKFHNNPDMLKSISGKFK